MKLLPKEHRDRMKMKISVIFVNKIFKINI